MTDLILFATTGWIPFFCIGLMVKRRIERHAYLRALRHFRFDSCHSEEELEEKQRLAWILDIIPWGSELWENRGSFYVYRDASAHCYRYGQGQ